MRYYILLFLFILSLISGCAGIQRSALNSHLIDLEQKFNHHTGLVLFDVEKDKIVYDYNGAKYFTPASNAKLLTFYTSLKLLSDSLITFAYLPKGDSIILWPAGDPSFLNPEFPESNVMDKLETAGKEVHLSFSHSEVEPFGPGWAWDDYPYTFSAERAALPLYGNYYSISETDSSLYISIPHFKNTIWLSDSAVNTTFYRDPASNDLFYYPGKEDEGDTTNIPFKTSHWLASQLLADTLKQSLYFTDIPFDTSASYIKSIPLDTVYKKLMQESNNFVAEQLLLQCAFVTNGVLNSETAIRYALNNYLDDLPQQPVWKDGSGLSRYNLITPNSLVVLLNKMYREFGRDKLFPLMAAGGKSGTLKDYYKTDPPYIFAKTGTLSNNHNLSGYLIAQSGKVFIFSFMNNNYPTSSSMVKKNMEEILWEVHLNN
ncbi:MAG: D-alanyl-D-alanine carboxypeptidase/D-alanyl-D-alanine-endopeptidase [Candidatus Cyclobacteriaceae bacterium M2_1C_046]